MSKNRPWKANLMEIFRKMRGEKTQEEIALKYEITRHAWSKYESGRNYPSLENLEKILDDNNISPNEALEGLLTPLPTINITDSSITRDEWDIIGFFRNFNPCFYKTMLNSLSVWQPICKQIEEPKISDDLETPLKIAFEQYFSYGTKNARIDSYLPNSPNDELNCLLTFGEIGLKNIAITLEGEDIDRYLFSPLEDRSKFEKMYLKEIEKENYWIQFPNNRIYTTQETVTDLNLLIFEFKNVYKEHLRKMYLAIGALSFPQSKTSKDQFLLYKLDYDVKKRLVNCLKKQSENEIIVFNEKKYCWKFLQLDEDEILIYIGECNDDIQLLTIEANLILSKDSMFSWKTPTEKSYSFKEDMANKKYFSVEISYNFLKNFLLPNLLNDFPELLINKKITPLKTYNQF